MPTEDEAVTLLRAAGVVARVADFRGRGAVFAVGGGEVQPGHHARGVYLVRADGGWRSFELGFPRARDGEAMSVADACARVVRLLGRRGPERDL